MKKDMEATSTTLFHFLDRAHKSEPNKQFETFKGIMESGLRFSEVNFLENVGCEAICFTDLPLQLSQEHVSVYGSFGLGFSKEFVRNHGGNPVFYIDEYLVSHEDNHSNIFRGPMSNLTKRLINEIRKKKHDDEIIQPLTLLLANCKEMGDIGPASDYTNRNDSYYKEREWRILNYTNMQIKEWFVQENDRAFIKVNPIDLRIIVTPNDEIRRKVVDYFVTNKIEAEMPAVICYEQYINL